MSNDAAPPMVELRGVTKRFGSVVAVDDVSLQIRPAEFLTLLGPSGCGKTTLLRMIAGFETPSEGTVHLAGADVTHTPPYRRDVNQVFQSYALFPHLTVEENIAFGLERKGLPRAEIAERVRRGIDLVALAGLEKRRPRELSGGQQQRVALARAIVCEPRVLLLDEPLAALDARLRRQMQIELKHLQRQLGITFVFVTHDQEEALTMSDRIAVVHQGRIEQIGDARAIYHEPRTRFVAQFIGETNILPAEVIARDGDYVRVRLTEGITLELHHSQVPRNVQRLLLSIRPEKLHLQAAPTPGATNSFDAVITDEVFKGASADLTLHHASGLQLICSVQNESAHERRFRRGDRVHCSLHPQDVVVVRE